jgi:intracellular sulfur oxidation DsrE/DsrF family protein
MNWKRMWLAAVLLMVSVSGVAQTAPAVHRHRVVFGYTLANGADWGMTAAHIRNLMDGLAPDTVEIEVVGYGPGVTILAKGSSGEADIVALIARHVRFVACQKAMHSHKLTEADLIPGVETVPSGIVEVVRKQEDGWSYIP